MTPQPQTLKESHLLFLVDNEVICSITDVLEYCALEGVRINTTSGIDDQIDQIIEGLGDCGITVELQDDYEA